MFWPLDLIELPPILEDRDGDRERHGLFLESWLYFQLANMEWMHT